MFQAREPQESLWQSEFLITPRKAKLMRRSWAEVFRNEALVLIEEERFAPMYSPDMGRPNRAVQTVLGVLVLKEMFDLTDMEALEELEFNLLWHHALRLEMEEARLAQKTLHNFRVRLMEHDGGRLAFSETTDRMIEALGLRTGKQRLDSTHVMSNIAVLTRLGLFCETVRVFLLARIHRCGAALGLEQGVRAVGRDGPRSIPINGAGGGLWLSLAAPMAVLGSGAGAGSAGQHAGEDNRGPGRCDSVGRLGSLVDVSGAVGAVRQAMAGLAIEPGRE